MKRQLKWYSFRWPVGFLIVLAVALWYVLLGRFQHPIGSGPARPAVDLRPFERIWSTRKIVLLGLGDSITAGYGSSGGDGYFGLLANNDDTLYPDMADRSLSRVFPNLKTLNYAVSCTTSQEHLEKQLPRIGTFDKHVFGVVVISSGGNDIIHDYGRSEPHDGAMYGCTYEQGLAWSGNFGVRLRGIVEGVNESFPGGCEIFVANVYDPTDGVGDIHNAGMLLPKWPDGLKVHGLFNQVIAETCEEYPNVHLVDIHSEFLGHGIHCRQRWNKHYRADDPHYWYFDNLEDPNDQGYDAIRRLFLLKMIEVLAEMVDG